MGNGIIIGAGSVGDRMRLELATRDGWPIPNVQCLERPPESLAAAAKHLQEYFPNAKPRSMSGTYNCMGLVFGCRRTCIDPEYLKDILKRDSYEKLDSIWDAEIGDVAVYAKDGEVQHVGIVIQVVPDLMKGAKTLLILSQWGRDGEWIHPHDCVPELLGKVSEIWTDRRGI